MSIQILNRNFKKSNFLNIKNKYQKKGLIVIKMNLFDIRISFFFDKNTKLRSTSLKYKKKKKSINYGKS